MKRRMDYWSTWMLIVSILFHTVLLTGGVELSFELSDNAKECFYQEIEKNVSSTLEFQVVTGGQYDVDVTLEAPNKEIIYKQVKTQFDSHPFVPTMSGVYKVCFSNEFSTFSHKLVYMDFQVGNELPLPGLGEHVTVMTQMESSAQVVHENLNNILDYQTHHRLREAQGRKRAEDLNERVLWWTSVHSQEPLHRKETLPKDLARCKKFLLLVAEIKRQHIHLNNLVSGDTHSRTLDVVMIVSGTQIS
ncbi:hypothetical protein HZH66_011715 [Vespula vulgaris]|uniref:GOLD domain-containing protein n=2 Tax=Vespula TaxID=7451 RepID=A0A834NIT6_VESPE|nr:hypothetical protein HZH66_011715 [Vespula vulgaris]KAF7409008.1 hypothetical protein H0235_013860 [Vespula pensylvanica]